MVNSDVDGYTKPLDQRKIAYSEKRK